MLTPEQEHALCLYPCVRIRSGKAMGSGTVLYVEPTPDEEGMFDIYTLTNEHVVDDLIKVEKRWNSLLKREVPTDILGQPDIEFFTFAYRSRAVGSTSYQSEIVAYDKEEDLALLRIRSPYEHKHCAQLIPEAEINRLMAFSPVWNVGCGMGAKPVITMGYLSSFGWDIDNKDYMLISAASYFGNSGGATFLADTGWMIGVPARIAVAAVGFSADVVTHLGFSISPARIYKFLRDQVFDFVLPGSERTSTECEEERRERREQDQYHRLFEEEERD